MGLEKKKPIGKIHIFACNNNSILIFKTCAPACALYFKK